ncbi:hypothetical protein M404DRAFT_24596 [Pisolithus tinctorius Marx 270]|uniref:C2H2-type domain-containing protein n=1 Tax=Pisolithus tinctorius Marx 270 TaxID=870435 RepID=A0A0C3JB68_PISTI|nr:hypothetical protein M404DRAFT_24596 [Pisolithus tinctorius Marx 270]
MPPARDDHTRRRPMQRPFETLRHPCDEPGCNRWFKNLSGLTQHKRTIHPCFHLFNQDRTGSPGDLGQEDDTLPSVNGHTAGVDDGHQEQDPLDQEWEQVRTEFVGPGRKLYRNYHTGLDARRCDAEGNFLPDDAPPPPRVQKSLDDWTPYRNRLEFKLTDFLFTHAEMSAKKLDTLLEIWAASLLALGGDPLFNNHAELYHVIDSTCVGEVPWEDFTIQYTAEVQDKETAPWMFDNYDVWYRDPQKVIHNILASSDLAAEMDYVPYQEYNAMNNERCWQDFMSGNWAWEEVDRIIHEFPMTGGATLVPIILGSDKTTMSVATGQTDYYPLYLSIGNMHNTVRRAHHNTVVLIAFLAMPKTTREHASIPEFHKFKRQLFHSSLTRILNSLHPAMKVPKVVQFGDGYYRRVIYRLAAYIADYEEQVLLSCIVLIAILELRDLWDKYGIIGDLIPFMNDFLRADIHRMLSPDILHQLIKGGFKDHLVDWVEKYLINIHGKTKAEKILNDIDCQIAAVAPFTGLQRFPQGQHFKQWTGNDSKGLMKVYIATIQGYVPRDMVQTFRAFLKFCYLVRRNVVTEQTLAEINDALRRFHYYREVFRNAGVVDSFSLPRQHAMKHYHHLICQFALGQMLLINQRLDKLSAARADFEECGMLNGTCLTHVLEVLGQNSHDDRDWHHDIAKGRNASDEAEEPTASYEEDSSDTVDTPMTINTHVLNQSILECKCAKDVGSLAAELEIPQFPEILRRFLHGQLYPADACDPQEIPFDECPFYDGKLRIYNSASSTFFVLSNLSSIYAHLIPIYSTHNINSRDVRPHCSYDMFHSFYVNKFADHHTFEIAF